MQGHSNIESKRPVIQERDNKEEQHDPTPVNEGDLAWFESVRETGGQPR
jgi:hypothetical protein